MSLNGNYVKKSETFRSAYIRLKSVKERPRILVLEVRIELLLPQQPLTLNTNTYESMPYTVSIQVHESQLLLSSCLWYNVV